MQDRSSIEFISEHLPYEIDMYRSCYRELATSSHSWAIRMALIEACHTHARTLFEFFTGHGRSRCITDFVRDGYVPLPWANVESLHAKISGQVSHVGGGRTSNRGKKVDALDPTTAQLIEAEIARLATHLRSEYEPLFK